MVLPKIGWMVYENLSEAMMGILSWIIFGLIAGALAKYLMPGKAPGGFVVTIVLGIIGASVGGFIGTFLGFGEVTGFNIRSFFVAVVGALIVLFAYGAITGRK